MRYHAAPPCAAVYRCVSSAVKYQNDVGRYHYGVGVSPMNLQSIGGGKKLEAFSIHLVNLSIWKRALHVFHTHAASAIEGSPSKETTKLKDISKMRHSPDTQECLDVSNSNMSDDVSSQIEKAFLGELQMAEELAKVVKPGNMEMPDAMELIYQSALALGKRGAVMEYMGDIENVVAIYSKAVDLLILFQEKLKMTTEDLQFDIVVVNL